MLIRFQKLVKSNQSLYTKCPKHTKLLVARAIVHAVQNQKPVGGRFMVNNCGNNMSVINYDNEDATWKPITYDQAVAKASQALRDAANSRSRGFKLQKPSKKALDIAMQASVNVKHNSGSRCMQDNLLRLANSLVKTAELSFVAEKPESKFAPPEIRQGYTERPQSLSSKLSLSSPLPSSPSTSTKVSNSAKPCMQADWTPPVPPQQLNNLAKTDLVYNGRTQDHQSGPVYRNAIERSYQEEPRKHIRDQSSSQHAEREYQTNSARQSREHSYQNSNQNPDEYDVAYYHQLLYGPEPSSESVIFDDQPTKSCNLGKIKNSSYMQRKDPPYVSPSPPHQGSMSKSQKKSKTGPSSFPRKLYEIIEDATLNEHEHIASWSEQGCAFVIHDHARFARELVRAHFPNHSDSHLPFIRRLLDWKFIRISPNEINVNGPGGLSYMHPFFQRGRKDLLVRIKRSSKSNTLQITEKFTKQNEEQSKQRSSLFCTSGYESEGSAGSLVI